jgi:hypothetical protein
LFSTKLEPFQQRIRLLPSLINITKKFKQLIGGIMMIKVLTKRACVQYDVTIFQTPKRRENKGHMAVYRTTVKAVNRENCLKETFSIFNVTDRIPENYKGRFLSTGDIIFIDEGRGGQYYYQLKPGGWVPINRINLL